MLHQRTFGCHLIPCYCLILLLVGCQKRQVELPSKAPRPVKTISLIKGVPTSSNILSGAVKSWKTEDLAFEVAGRLQWVLEPGKNVTGRVLSPDGDMIDSGMPLAKIDPARYEIALESAKANLAVATLNKEGIQIRLKDSLPAEISSARSDLKLAEIEFDRMKRLNQQNAASRSEYDQARNAVSNRDAAIKSLLASQKQAEAQLRSADAEIQRAQQAVNDALRDLDNTTLYGSYRGQISKVMVVPGSVISAGSPVLTLQMTSPIKAEIELSAKQSRRLRQQRNLPAKFTLPDGTTRSQNAFVYNIDPSADPTTRTFTMTLLILNEQFDDSIPESNGKEPIARAADIWPIRLNRMMGAPDDTPLIEEASILRDEDGPYIYAVTNAKLHDTLPKILEVQKMRIVEQELRIPFLGNWIFRAVKFLDGPEFDDRLIYVGELKIADVEPSDWSGTRVVLDSGKQWMLRPGDLISVDVSGDDTEAGFYVPMQSIYEVSDKTSVFVVQNSKARKIDVQIRDRENLDAGSMVLIESPELRDGMRLVVGGVHYLDDGDEVTQIASADEVSK